MKGLNNEHLPDYVKLMKQIVEFMHSPLYINMFKNKDKKLTKNMIKRCVVEPFCDKIMKNNESNGFEISRFNSQTHIFKNLNEIFIQLDKFDLLTDALMFNLKAYLESYLTYIESEPELKTAISEIEFASLRALLIKCKYANEEIDPKNKMQVLKLFNGKKIQKMSKYIKELLNLNQQIQADKKFLKKIFETKP